MYLLFSQKSAREFDAAHHLIFRRIERHINVYTPNNALATHVRPHSSYRHFWLRTNGSTNLLKSPDCWSAHQATTFKPSFIKIGRKKLVRFLLWFHLLQLPITPQWKQSVKKLDLFRGCIEGLNKCNKNGNDWEGSLSLSTLLFVITGLPPCNVIKNSGSYITNSTSSINSFTL